MIKINYEKNFILYVVVYCVCVELFIIIIIVFVNLLFIHTKFKVEEIKKRKITEKGIGVSRKNAEMHLKLKQTCF